MLSVYCLAPAGLKRLERNRDAPLPEEAVCSTCSSPRRRRAARRSAAGPRHPHARGNARNRIVQRFYEEAGALYLTATIVTKLDTSLPENAQVTFILKDSRLVTNRYVDPLPFTRFVGHTERHPLANTSAHAVLAGLLESIINRIADVIEHVGADLDAASADVFNRKKLTGRQRSQRDYRKVLERIGECGELIAKARESLGSLARLLAFVQQSTITMPQEVRTRLRTPLEGTCSP